MLADLSHHNIYFYNQPTDMRKGFNGLAGLVNKLEGANLTSGDIFVFVNKSKDKIKLLQWEKNGFAIYYKQLEKGTFEWPTEEPQSVTIDYQKLYLMFEGIAFESVVRRPRYGLKI